MLYKIDNIFITGFIFTIKGIVTKIDNILIFKLLLMFLNFPFVSIILLHNIIEDEII